MDLIIFVGHLIPGLQENDLDQKELPIFADSTQKSFIELFVAPLQSKMNCHLAISLFTFNRRTMLRRTFGNIFTKGSLSRNLHGHFDENINGNNSNFCARDLFRFQLFVSLVWTVGVNLCIINSHELGIALSTTNVDMHLHDFSVGKKTVMTWWKGEVDSKIRLYRKCWNITALVNNG